METKRFTLEGFGELCKKNGYIPTEEIMELETDAFLKNINFIDIPLSSLEEMKHKKEERDQWESSYQDISSFRLNGMEYEKTGNIESAIFSYRICIEKGEQSTFNMFHAYAHAYDRLIILLHKSKQYDLEAQYIKSLLAHDSLSTAIIDKYKNRLNKLNQKK